MIDLRSLELTLGLVLIASACEPKPAEETHVLLSSCGLELACEPMRFIFDIHPPSAEKCAQALLDEGRPGLLSVFHESDGDSYPPHQEDAILILSDGSLLLQSRRRDCGDKGYCEEGPWKAWGPHQECSLSGTTFYPDLYDHCEDVPDWTCEDVEAAVTP
jgi:hypothetical protein